MCVYVCLCGFFHCRHVHDGINISDLDVRVSPFYIQGCCKMGPALHPGKRPLCWWRRQIMAIELQWSDMFTTMFVAGYGRLALDMLGRWSTISGCRS